MPIKKATPLFDQPSLLSKLVKTSRAVFRVAVDQSSATNAMNAKTWTTAASFSISGSFRRRNVFVPRATASTASDIRDVCHKVGAKVGVPRVASAVICCADAYDIRLAIKHSNDAHGYSDIANRSQGRLPTQNTEYPNKIGDWFLY